MKRFNRQVLLLGLRFWLIVLVIVVNLSIWRHNDSFRLAVLIPSLISIPLLLRPPLQRAVALWWE